MTGDVCELLLNTLLGLTHSYCPSNPAPLHIPPTSCRSALVTLPHHCKRLDPEWHSQSHTSPAATPLRLQEPFYPSYCTLAGLEGTARCPSTLPPGVSNVLHRAISFWQVPAPPQKQHPAKPAKPAKPAPLLPHYCPTTAPLLHVKKSLT